MLTRKFLKVDLELLLFQLLLRRNFVTPLDQLVFGSGGSALPVDCDGFA